MPSNPQETQQCPICKTPQRKNLRYPSYLCPECAGKAVDSNGRALTFYNESFSGGFVAHFKDDGSKADEITKSHVVFVDGKRVWADEARFGGIVLELLGGEEGSQTSGL
jgi:hypothetical protein